MKILSIGFHQGCCDALETVLTNPDILLTSKTLPIGVNDYDYVMTNERAAKIWMRDKDYFNGFDVVITSDTAPLSRIFLQNNYRGRLIIWCCNRVDYAMTGQEAIEYFGLLHDAMADPRVTMIGYTEFETMYCAKKGICLAGTIRPVLKPRDYKMERVGYYIPDYQNNHNFKLAYHCISGGLDTVTGRHGGIQHLSSFKAVVHLPYHWQGIQNAELLSVGTPYLVPSKRFLFEIMRDNRYWFQNQNELRDFIDICDFYNKRNSNFMFYFDSWDDIRAITPDYDAIFIRAEYEYARAQNDWYKILEI